MYKQDMPHQHDFCIITLEFLFAIYFKGFTQPNLVKAVLVLRATTTGYSLFDFRPLVGGGFISSTSSGGWNHTTILQNCQDQKQPHSYILTTHVTFEFVNSLQISYSIIPL